MINGNKNDVDEEKSDDKGANSNQRRRKKDKAAAQIELFNLAADPYEKMNLAETKPEKVKQLQARYNAYAKQAVPPKNVK